MNDLRTAAQQALEALESDPVPANAINNAASFLRAALAQEQDDDWTRCHHCGQTMPPVPLAQEQAEPIDTDCHAQGICQRSGYGIGQQAEPVEPVAHRAFLERILTAMEGVIDVADRKTDEFDALRSCVIDLTLMLHTAPPQRTMVPLTEEEIDNICRQAHGGADPQEWARNFARAIERAHGIGETK